MEDDPELEDSSLSGPVSSGGRTVDVQIYRLVGQQHWTLEIVDEYNNSTVWDDTFETDAQALVEAKKSILKDTVSAYVGPADGKSDGEWQ